jgi:hypothetical protein
MTLPELTVPGLVILVLAIAMSVFWYIAAGRKDAGR